MINAGAPSRVPTRGGAAEVVEGYGLRSIRLRAEELGGQISAGSTPRGFRLRVEVPHS